MQSELLSQLIKYQQCRLGFSYNVSNFCKKTVYEYSGFQQMDSNFSLFCTITYVGRQKFSGPATLSRYSIETFDILYLYGGEATFSSSKTSISLHENEALLIPKNTNYTISNASTSLDILLISCVGYMCETYLQLVLDSVATVVVPRSDSNFEQLLQQLLLHIRHPFQANSVLIVHTFSQLLMTLYRSSLNQEEFDATTGQPNWFIAVSKFIDNNYNHKITIEDMAESCKFSASHFYKMFREYTGDSPYKYLTSVRIQHAQYLLQNTDFTIQSVAKEVGFSNVNHFNEHFKNEIGLTPSSYRKKFCANA